MKYVLLRVGSVGAATALMFFAGSASGQLFSDNFDSILSPVTVTASGTSSGYNILFNQSVAASEDFTAIFGFDYSTVTYPVAIPSAPNSTGGTTKGLFLTVNKADATAANTAVNLYPVGQTFAGSFSMRFDVYMNWTNLATSTEHSLFGINHSGAVVNRAAKVGSDGLFYAMSGDGGSSATSATVRDFTVFQGQGGATAPLLKTTGFGPAAPLGSTFDNANAGFSALFPSKPIYGGTPAGTPGMGWVTGEIRQEFVGSDILVSWLLNSTLVAQYTNTTAYTSGDIMVGYNDVFTSIGDTNNFVIFDNIRVDVVPEPSFFALAGLGGVLGSLLLRRQRRKG